MPSKIITDLPPEIRNVFWQLTVVGVDVYAYSLTPPAILQVNRQIRNEALSMFYTQNSFRVNVPLGIGETEQRPFNWNVRRLSFDCDAWERMCFALGQYFKHITEIKFSFAEPVFKKKYNHMFGFVYKSRDIGQLCPGPEGRVGNDDLDWNNDDKVGDAFYDTLDDMNFYEYDGMRFDGIYTVVPFDDVSEAMIRFTEFCPGEVKYIKLFWHWEMM